MLENKSLRAQVLGLAVGEELTIPISLYGYTTIRSYASDLGFAINGRFRTRRNKVERTYTIIREA
jgi:glutamate formiminotransferase